MTGRADESKPSGVGEPMDETKDHCHGNGIGDQRQASMSPPAELRPVDRNVWQLVAPLVHAPSMAGRAVRSKPSRFAILLPGMQPIGLASGLSLPGLRHVVLQGILCQPCRPNRNQCRGYRAEATMTTQVSATWTGGVLKPDAALPLADQTRVRLTVEPIGEWSPERSRAAWDAIQALLRERPINSGGLRFTRGELHERR